jgi:hypothetical protein
LFSSAPFTLFDPLFSTLVSRAGEDQEEPVVETTTTNKPTPVPNASKKLSKAQLRKKEEEAVRSCSFCPLFLHVLFIIF